MKERLQTRSCYVGCERDDDGNDKTILPSFPGLRQQNLSVLYNNSKSTDKSRAGGVDPHIQALVNCINRHQSYVTLSSCSGRISLFDPHFLVRAEQHEQPQTREFNSEHSQENDLDAAVCATLYGQIPPTATSSGKGGTGGWLLVSHDPVDPTAFLRFFPNPGESKVQQQSSPSEANESVACMLKFEPMLLHVAACNLQRGRQLLQIALQAGFRESGLIVTDQRITVAIRTQSLTMTVPLSYHLNNPLLPTTTYLQAITVEANRRLLINLQRLQKLHENIERSLCHDDLLAATAADGSSPSCRRVIAAAHPLPDLNLYGHAVVVVSAVVQQTIANDATLPILDLAPPPPPLPQQHLLVFGGYGLGPLKKHTNAKNKTSQQRSDRIYSLRRDGGVWESEWQTVEVASSQSSSSVDSQNSTTVISLLHGHQRGGEMHLRPADWNARQGVAVAHVPSLTVLSPENPPSTPDPAMLKYNSAEKKQCALILLFGGRQGPAKPCGDLLLFTYHFAAIPGEARYCCRGQFFQPVDIRGKAPSPRWGHALTAMGSRPPAASSSLWNSNNNNNSDPVPIALLTGGRDERDTNPDSIYLLSVVPEVEEGRDNEIVVRHHFLWELLDIESSPPLVTIMLCRFYHTAVALGNDRVFVFGGLLSSADNLMEAFDTDSTDDRVQCAAMITLNREQKQRNDCIHAHVEHIQQHPSIPHRFGHSACLLTATFAGEICVLLSGGVYKATSGYHSTAMETDGGDQPENIPLFQCVKLVMVLPSHKKEQHQQVRWAMESRSIQWDFLHKVKGGAFVHHCCACLKPSVANGTDEIAVVGGGVSGFAFQECYAQSHFITLLHHDVDNDVSQPFADGKRGQTAGPRRTMQQQRPPHLCTATSTVVMSTCDVVYVTKQNAKTIKTQLEELSLLDKRYRLTVPMDEGVIRMFEGIEYFANTCVAVPVVPDCIALLLLDQNRDDHKDGSNRHRWVPDITGYGQQVCPYSSGTFARGVDRSKGQS